MRINLPDARAFADLFESKLSIHLNTPPTGISTDNREILPGDLFLALPGEKVDGHQFIDSAARAGAVAVLGTHRVNTDSPVQQCIVDSVVQVMGELALQWRRSFSIPVIGITGSNGKTTTKELLKHYLADQGLVHATEGNFNTSIGLPL
ncbi:MAG: UDP-N-acetylmuramoyl-tripeptide--D-alanyl-D-alanine ligase, partial [FCB group bacterium]|nr:UDP-N-acetylmuramoyl-tripeptide--D-alanyl-D-alanine ligase [FCB group bacterium]